MLTWADLGIDLPPEASGEVATTCPQCSRERKKRNAKCLSVNVDKGVAYCNHCGWSGTLAGKEERFPPAWRKPEYRKPEPVPQSELPKFAAEFFAGRGITPEVLERTGVTVATVYMPQLEENAEAIVFPYRRDGEVVNHKYRARGKLFRMDTGAERILYNLDAVDDECVVICEGELDCLALQVAGISSCVSVPDGAPAENTRDYSAKFTFLDADSDRLELVKKIVLAVDSDAPGKRLEDELARRLGRERCFRVDWPQGCKDANDVLVQHDAELLRQVITTAVEFPIEGVFSVLDARGEIFKLYRNGLERGVSTGWRNLDQHYTVRPGELTVVIGVPGSGKSNFVDALAVNLAATHGWSFALFSPENQPIQDHMARIVEKYIGQPFSDGPTPRMDEDSLQDGAAWADEHFFWMLPDNEESWRIEWILARAGELCRRKGISGLVIDPWNELEAQRGDRETETEYVSRVLRAVRQFARKRSVHVFLVVHPTKLYRDKDGKYPIPTLYDSAGSAHFRNKADNGLCIWRDFSDVSRREVDIHVQKIRFRQIGKLGKVSLTYEPATATYSEQLPQSDNAWMRGGA